MNYRKQALKYGAKYAAPAAVFALAATSANAVIDVTAVTTGITDAATALGLVIAGLMSLSVGIFGITKVYRFVSRKAGA